MLRHWFCDILFAWIITKWLPYVNLPFKSYNRFYRYECKFVTVIHDYISVTKLGATLTYYSGITLRAGRLYRFRYLIFGWPPFCYYSRRKKSHKIGVACFSIPNSNNIIHKYAKSSIVGIGESTLYVRLCNYHWVMRFIFNHKN